MWFRGRGKADRAIAAYQRELVDTHYREVENMYRQIPRSSPALRWPT